MHLGKPTEVMMTMTTLMANHTPPGTPQHHQASPSLPQPGRYQPNKNPMFGATTMKNLTNQKFYVNVLPRFPTTCQMLQLPTSLLMMMTPLPHLTLLLRKNGTNSMMNATTSTLNSFTYTSLNTATRMIDANASHLNCSINHDDDDHSANDHEFPAQQHHVFEELDTINHQLSQLLDKLKNDPQSPFRQSLARIFTSSMQPNRDISNPQQPAPLPETQIVQLPKCVTTGLVPPAPNPAPRPPGNPLNLQSTPTTIPNTTKMVVCDCIPCSYCPLPQIRMQAWFMMAHPSGHYLDWQ